MPGKNPSRFSDIIDSFGTLAALIALCVPAYMLLVLA